MGLTPETIERVEALGIRLTDRRLHLRIPNARRQMECVMETLLGERAKWLPEYDMIADWLTDNHRKGLLLTGMPGLGKTLMCERVLPTIIGLNTGLWVQPFSAVRLAQEYARISRLRLIALDDVGTEPVLSHDYGTPHSCFNELLDLAEHRDMMLLLTTNLSPKELADRYGARADRLHSLVRPIILKGQSMR